MNDLSIIVKQNPAEISTNFGEVKERLAEQMAVYMELEVTEKSLVERKKDVATLRKIEQSIKAKVKEVKDTYMTPYDVFKQQSDELLALVQQPIDLIAKQTKEFDEKRKAEKKERAYEYYAEITQGDGNCPTFDSIFRSEWTNANQSWKKTKADLDTIVSDYKADISAIKAMDTDEDVTNRALTKYYATHKLSDALKIITDYEAEKKRILEAEERKRKAEEERQRREAERAKQEAERKQRQEEERQRREEEERKHQEEIRRKQEEERKLQEERQRIREEERRKAVAEAEKARANTSVPSIPVLPAGTTNEDPLACVFIDMGDDDENIFGDDDADNDCGSCDDDQDDDSPFSGAAPIYEPETVTYIVTVDAKIKVKAEHFFDSLGAKYKVAYGEYVTREDDE